MAELTSINAPRFVMCELDVSFDCLNGHGPCLACLSARVARSRTHLCHQARSTEVDVGQRKRGERTRGVLSQAAVTHLAKPPQALDHAEHALDPNADARLAAVLRSRGFVDFALPVAHALVGGVLGPRRLAGDQLLLAGIRLVASEYDYRTVSPEDYKDL